MNMSQRIDDLIFISEHLIALLHKENAALVNKDNDTIATLIEEKDALCRAYEQRALVLTKYSDQLNDGEIEKERVELVRDLSARIDELIEQNSTLLRAAIEANSLVMSLVAQAVRETQRNAGTYGANGNVSKKTLKSPTEIAVSFDQSL
jgi:hypothetical protein